MLEALERVADQNARLVDQNARLMEMMMGGRAPQAVVAPVPAPAPPPLALVPHDTLTVAELWERYVESLAGKTWLPSVRSLMRDLLHHLAPSLCSRNPGPLKKGKPRKLLGPDMLAANLRAFHWSDFRDQLKRTKPNLTVGTRNLMIARLKTLYFWGLDEGRLTANPIARIKMEPGRPKRETTISDAEIDQVESVIVKAYLLTMVDSGMRPGEVRKLRRDQFNLNTGRTLLSWTSTKTRKTRPAWVTERVFEAFRAIPEVPGNPYIFASPRNNGRPYSVSGLWILFQKERKRIGMVAAPGDGIVHCHDGRRSFATRLSKKKVPINRIQHLLGHAKIATTEKYVDVSEDDLIEAHGQLDAAKRRPAQAKKPPKTDE